MASNATVSIILKMIDKASGTMNKVSSSSKKLSTNMKSLGTSMTRNVSLPLLAIGAAGIKMAVDLDKSMRNIQAFGGQSEDQIKALSQTFKDMSLDAKNGTQSAQQLADAYFNIQSAGFLGAEGMEVLAVSARAATAGLTTTQKASEGIMTVLNAYSLTAENAEEVSDLLFTTIKLGVGTFEQLVPTLGKVVPLASAMGVEFDEVSASLVQMSKVGIDFREGTTAMAGAMRELLAPGDKLQQSIEQLGFASGQALVDSVGFTKAIAMLGNTVGNTAQGMNQLFLNSKAANGMVALVGAGAIKTAAALEEMQNAGAAQEAFNKQMQSFSAQFSIFKNTLGVFLIDVGEKLLPILMKLMEGVRGAFKAWQDMDSGVQTVIVGIGAFLAIGGPLLIFFGAIFGAIGTIAGGFGALAGALGLTAAASAPAAVGIGATAAATTALAIPLSAILIPLGLLTAAFILLTGSGDELLAFVGSMIKGFGDLAKGVVQAVSDVGNFVLDGIGKITTGAADLLGFDIGKQTGDAYGTGIASGMVEGVVEGANATGEILNDMGEQVVQFANQMSAGLAQAAGGFGIGGKFVMPTGSGPGGVQMQSIASGNFGVANQQAIQQQFAGQDAARLAAVQAMMAESNKRIEAPIKSLTQGLQQIVAQGKVEGNFGDFLRKFKIGEDDPRIAAAFKQFVDRTGKPIPGSLQEMAANADRGASSLMPLASGAGGGDVNITIENLNITEETTEQQVRELLKKLGNSISRRGV